MKRIRALLLLFLLTAFAFALLRSAAAAPGTIANLAMSAALLLYVVWKLRHEARRLMTRRERQRPDRPQLPERGAWVSIRNQERKGRRL